jgi:hypothetical protein
VGRDGVDVIQRWFGGATKQARAKFRNKLRNLSRLPRDQWRRPLFDSLGDEGRGLSEIRFDADHVPWRPLGFFQLDDDGKDVFTIVICAGKDEHGWIPANACEVGLRRKAEILADQARAHDLPIAF